LIDTKSPNRTTQKGSPKENKSRKTSDEKERRNSRSHSSSKDTHSSNYYNNKKGHQSKPRHKNENQRRSDNKKLKPVVDLVEKNQKMKKVGTENLKVVKIVDEEKLKQKALGLSILECPCSMSPTEGCSDCSPDSKKDNSTVANNNLNVNTSKKEQDGSVIDTKFLIASPRNLHKEKSVLESDTEIDGPLNGSIDGLSNDPFGENESSLTPDEVNAMFKNVENKDTSVNRNREEMTNDGYGSQSGDSNLTISSSSDAGSNKRLSEIGTSCRKSRESEMRSRLPPKQRNVLSSIKSILNENKTLDAKSTVNNENKRHPKSNDREKKKEKNNQRQDKRPSKSESRRNRHRKESSKRKDYLKAENSSAQPKSTGGILNIPLDHQDQIQLNRQVHFGAEGLFT